MGPSSWRDGSPGRPGIIAFRGGFHGRTYGATSVTTSNLNYRTGYEPLLPGVYFAPYPGRLQRLRRAMRRRRPRRVWPSSTRCSATVIAPSRVAAILIEPVQGEGGFTPAPAAFLQGLRALCDEHGILLIADEVQSGYGRTGKMWAFEHAGIVPDVVCVAKAIANGLPLSAIVSSREPAGALGTRRPRLDLRRQPGRLRGRPGRARDVPRRVAGRECRRARCGADGGPGPDRRRGRRGSATSAGPGLMVGVEFVRDRSTREPDGAAAGPAECCVRGCRACWCLPADAQHEVVRWLPPIDVSAAEIAEAVEIFGETLTREPRG